MPTNSNLGPAASLRYKILGATGAAIALALLWVVFHFHARNEERFAQVRKIEAVVRKGMTADQVEKALGPPDSVKGFKRLPEGVEDPKDMLYSRRCFYGEAVISMHREVLENRKGNVFFGGPVEEEPYRVEGVYGWQPETERDLEDLARRWVWLLLWLDIGALCGGHFALEQGWKPVRGILLGMVIGPMIYFLPAVKKVRKRQQQSSGELRPSPAEPGAAADGGRDPGS